MLVFDKLRICIECKPAITRGSNTVNGLLANDLKTIGKKASLHFVSHKSVRPGTTEKTSAGRDVNLLALIQRLFRRGQPSKVEFVRYCKRPTSMFL